MRNTKQSNTFALFPVPRHEGDKMMSHYLGLALTPCFVTTISRSFMDGQIDYDHYKRPALNLFVTIRDHMWPFMTD